MSSISIINLNEPKKKANYVSTSAIGALAGLGARYVVPTKNDVSNLINKTNVDSFVSSAATTARSQNRSMLKYAGIGAAVASAFGYIANKIASNKTVQKDDYSKMGVFLDAPDYAYSFYCYGDKQ